MDRNIGRLFRAICSGGGDRQVALDFSALNWSSARIIRDTVDAAVYHAIVPLVTDALTANAAPDPLMGQMMSVYRSQAAQVLRLEELLTDVTGAFGVADVRFVVFKGASVGHGYYAKARQRTYVDVDLLVRAEDLPRADTVLRDMGCLTAAGSWQEALSEGYGEVFYRAPSGAALDLHWHPIREPAVRREFSLNTSEMIERSRTMNIGDISVPVLDTEDALVTVCTHACYDGAYRLGWLVDAAWLDQSDELRRGVLIARCQATGLGLPVQIVLDRARRTLGYTPGVAALHRSTWRALMGAVTAIRPVEYTFGQAGRGGILFRATRRDAPSSAKALGTLAFTEVARPLVTDPEHRWKRGRTVRDRAN